MVTAAGAAVDHLAGPEGNNDFSVALVSPVHAELEIAEGASVSAAFVLGG